jgi:hypothetical protein
MYEVETNRLVPLLTPPLFLLDDILNKDKKRYVRQLLPFYIRLPPSPMYSVQGDSLYTVQ